MIVLAVVLRTGTWWYPHTLFGVMEYDDGVYYAAAKLLLHGTLPYEGFTIVHPPVVSLLLLPAAAVGELFGDPAGMAAARIGMQLVAIANVLLIYRIARLLPGGRGVALIAAGLYAINPTAVIAEHTVLLEPLVNLGCLSGAYLLLCRPTGRSATVAGALIAAACGVKLFAGVYVLVLLGWLVARHRRLVPAFAGGLAAGTAVFVLPFVLADPRAFWHDVVVTQLSRPKVATDTGVDRLVNMVGLGYAPYFGLLLLAALLVVAYRRHPEEPLLAPWLALALLAGLAFAFSSSYFPHYGAFLAPVIALLASRLTRSRWQHVTLGLVTVFFLVGVGADLAGQQGQADLRSLARDVPKGSCVYSDAVSLPLAAGLFDDPSPACPGFVDGRGVALTQNTDWPGTTSFYPAGFLADRRWQQANVGQMRHADFLLLRVPPSTFPEWAAGTRAYVLEHFRPVWSRDGRQHSELWKRTVPG